MLKAGTSPFPWVPGLLALVAPLPCLDVLSCLFGARTQGSLVCLLINLLGTHAQSWISLISQCQPGLCGARKGLGYHGGRGSLHHLAPAGMYPVEGDQCLHPSGERPVCVAGGVGI